MTEILSSVPPHPLRFKHFPEYIAARITSSLVQMLSEKQTASMGRSLGEFIYDRWSSRRLITQENIGRVFSQLSTAERSALARAVFAQTAHTFLEFARIAQFGEVELDARISVDASVGHLAHANDRPVIYVSAHLGNWEYLGRWLANHHGPIGLLINAQTNPLVDRMIMGWRRNKNIIFVPYRSGWTRLSQLLAQGTSIALLADQRLDRGGMRLPFFGHETSWSKLPALLARRHDVPLIPLFLPRSTATTFKLEICPPIYPNQAVAVEEDLIRLTQEYIRACELVIRTFPEQYLFTHRRWAGAAIAKPILSATGSLTPSTAADRSPLAPSRAPL